MRRLRRQEGFNIAFLDIMACGLGAIVLVFMIVKQNVEKSTLEIELLQADLERLSLKEEEIKTLIKELETAASSETTKISSLQNKIAALRNNIKKTSDEVSRKKLELSSVKKTIKNAPKAKKDDVIEKDIGGEENYIMGLRVEGPKIAILLDASSSMTDEKLIDIIKRKNASDKTKQEGPKWKRTRRVVDWLLARLPKSSQVSVVVFSDNARILGSKGWMNSRNAEDIGRLIKDVDSIVPDGPTNLQIGLEKLVKLRPSDVYLITDGLPTEGESNYRSLNPFASCGSLLGSSTKISGECRIKLFRQTLDETAQRLRSKVNVVLLPLEGDPDASPELWAWTSSTGGLLISPAMNWP